MSNWVRKAKPKLKKLKRDWVVSSTEYGDLVGVYFADTGGEEVLIECSPEDADKIISVWNEVVDKGR